MPKPNIPIVEDLSINSAKEEEQHVHEVYEVIAPHFSQTRYKPWPVVEKFMTSIPTGQIGADVGCGNGKYLGLNKNIFTIGSDRSSNLIKICKDRGLEAMVCDNLNLPYRNECFDYAISIAVIHHFTTPERRIAAIEEILRVTKKSGKILIFVWALEQQGKRKFDQNHQDVYVPWALPKELAKQYREENKIPEEEQQEIVLNRYYHLFREHELDDLVCSTNEADIIESGYDRDNWYVIAQKR
ncbi:tRNA methyltransferase, has a role in tRNA modification [Basidiobolus ranarum]|uniref:tRNA methyltransferase, has a role in tRNA modification n=1 Tax=Basidiobolus ranarum TaxID=34480 RepID=A0ABR2WUD8_9FUNG